MSIHIDRWLDLDSEEYLTWPHAKSIKNIISTMLKLSEYNTDITIDNNGILYEDGDVFHRKFPTETVGLKWMAKAPS